MSGNEFYKILEEKFDTLPEYMNDKSIKISEAIGGLGHIHMEAIAVLLDDYLNAIRSLEGFSENVFEMIKMASDPQPHISNEKEIVEMRKLDILSIIRREN